MNSQEQYQLRIGVFHHPTLKIEQLCNFLTSQCDDFLKNELQQSLMVRENFTSSFEPFHQTNSTDINQFIGLILLYSSSSAETFNYAKQLLTLTDSLDNTFRLLVQMENSQKHLNEIGTEGEKLAQTHNLVFIRLNLYNSQELVNTLNRNLYLIVENYYYPNQEERPRPSNIELVQASPSEFLLTYNDSQQKIMASSQQKQKVMELIQKAAQLRSSREKEMVSQQSAIDDSIENVQKMLNNINRHIKLKLQSDWFTSLRDSLYKPGEKESRLYNKIKLTQEFIEEQKPKQKRVPLFKSRQFVQSIHNSKYNYGLQQTLKKLDSSLFKIVIIVDLPPPEAGQNMAELEVYENSTYEELASNALRKLGLRENERNLRIMTQEVKAKIDIFVRQLSKKVRQLERQRTFERSYLAVSKK